MSTGRTLGRGRVLGNAKNIAPAASSSSSPAPTPSHVRNNSSLLSPTPSATSLPSDVSTPLALTPQPQDLAANVSLGGNAAAAAASSRLVCPICNEEMVTLLQLNRHLDDLHQNLEEIEQDEVKDWFRSQLTKAKKFQPLAVLNQKFKGLDVFEANDPPAPVIKHSQSETAVEKVTERIQEPDEVVTRTHWQQPSYNDSCADPMCGKRLGGANGSVNCRKCGALYCEEHTMYQMKLSRSAQHEPVRGVWCRVCETCYKSREGYNDHRGLERNHFSEFVKTRRRTVDKQYLEISRLEKRLSRLTQLLANPPPEESTSRMSALWGGKARMQVLEQSVIDWEEDATVPKCPFCQQEFTSYTFRRHHCRTCGRVVCGDLKTECSANVVLDVASMVFNDPRFQSTEADALTENDQQLEKTAMASPQTVAVEVRLCKDCRHTLFSRADYDREVAHKPPSQRAYENLVEFERGIRLLLPRFQKLLLLLQDPDNPPTKAQVDQATKTRKRLTDSFTQYSTAATRLRDLQSPSPTQLRLQKQVYNQAMNFLHLHMLPLKSLPKILKHATPNGANKASNGGNTSGKGALASIQFNAHLNAETASHSSRSSAIESLEAEEKELRERLILLEEQKFIVSEALADARKRRRFDDVKTLQANVEELGREVDIVQKQIGELDFAGVYK